MKDQLHFILFAFSVFAYSWIFLCLTSGNWLVSLILLFLPVKFIAMLTLQNYLKAQLDKTIEKILKYF
jgi:putative effector of murein hydrolase LrgA (UPF0299 family)